MANETQRAVFESLREHESRFTYYLLTAAAAGIALSVNQTHDAVLAWSQVLLGAAVLCWGCSFICGCLHLRYVRSNLFANLDLLRVQAGEHPDVDYSDPRYIEAVQKGIFEAITENASSAGTLGNAQFVLIPVGALFFVLWHIYGMYLRRLVEAVCV